MSVTTRSPKKNVVKKNRILEAIEYQLLEYLFINGVKRPSQENKELYEDLAAHGYIRKTNEDAYRVTMKGKQTLYHDADLTERKIPAQKFFKGDHITLCQTEYDSDAYDIVFRIQMYKEGASETFIALEEHYDIPVMEQGQKTYRGLRVDTVEMSHCLAEEYDSKTRQWEPAY